MKTKAILAATAAAFLLTSGPTFAADTQAAQTQTKRCYRNVHKVPFPVRVRCPKEKAHTPSEPTKSESAQKQPSQSPAQGQNP